MARWLWLIAGPNGAGKSTRGRELLGEIEEVVRPDDIAANLSRTTPQHTAVRAARDAILRTRDLLAGTQSFAIETTLAGRRYLEVIRKAKLQGWKIGLIYIGLGSPELAIERVRQRRAAGGHDVPIEDIRRRYKRSLDNVPALHKLTDRSLYFDNSSHTPTKLIELDHGKTVFSRRKLPQWLRSGLPIEWKSQKKVRRRK